MVIFFPCKAQNLVPNPSFELYTSCPTGIGSVAYSPGYTSFPTVKSWVNPLSNGTADYFNTCASTISYASVPQNSFGTQPPRNGNGYIGIIPWQGVIQNGNMTNVFGEYIECKLTQPMVPGGRYCVTFYVSSSVANATYNFVGIDKVGIHFSNAQISQATGYSLNLPYHISNATGAFLTDTSGWTKINGIYTAQGGEQWLTLGWFNNGGTPNFQPIKPSTPNPADYYRTYLYIDDVSVVPLKPTDTVFSRKDSVYCNRSLLPITLSSSAELAEYKWNNGNTAAQLIAIDSGTYWCVSKGHCQTYIDTFVLKYEPAKPLELPKELVNCNNQPVEVNANYPNTSYQWSTGETTEKITVNKTGTYILSINDKCGVQKDTVNVYIQPPTPEPAPLDTAICQFVMNPSITVTGKNVKWYTQAEGKFGSAIQPPIITKDPGVYKLFITQTLGKCESEKVPANIDVRYTPHDILGDKVVMCENNIETIGTFIPDVKYKWNTGYEGCCMKADRDGRYMLSMTNECGNYVDTLWVYHTSCEDCITFPNAFTPQSEFNRTFKPLLKCPVDEFHIRIFNRWGNVVFESKDMNIGWDGRYSYDWCDQGVYIYIVDYKAKDKKHIQQLRGNVSLLR